MDGNVPGFSLSYIDVNISGLFQIWTVGFLVISDMDGRNSFHFRI